MRGNIVFTLVVSLGCSSAPGLDLTADDAGASAVSGVAPAADETLWGPGGAGGADGIPDAMPAAGTGGVAALVDGTGGGAGAGGLYATGGTGGALAAATAGAGGMPAGGGSGGVGGGGGSGGAPLDWIRHECSDSEVTAYRVRPGECIWVHGRFAQLNDPTCAQAAWDPAVCDALPGYIWDTITQRCYQGCAIVDNVHPDDRVQSFTPEPGMSYTVDRYEMVGGKCPKAC